ncbi:MAG: Gfo/Idh/MocA family oxidoreductase [Clostridia bacterium]|nr:Gfo/Idh/MocA family oxidoreductase [Clostridia bacterium]
MREIKPIKIAILSCSHGHAKGYYSLKDDPFYELVGVSVEPGYRPLAKLELLGDVPTYDSDEELYLAHPEIEAVVIASANRKHIYQVREAVRRGLHIYSMKVPTYDLDEYREMIDLTEAAGLVCQVELEMRHHTEIYRVKELIESGAIGELLSVNMLNYSHNPGWWRPWQVSPEESWGKRERISPDSPLYRGGALADHPHVFDLARFLTGSTFESVHAEVAPNLRALETEDLIRVMGRMKSGVLFSIDPSYANDEHKVVTQVNWEKYPRCVEVTLNVVGSKGSIIADLYGRAFSSQRDEGGYYLSSGPGTVGLWNRRMQEFYECVRFGMKPPVGLREHYESIVAMVAAYESAYTGKTVKLDFDEPVALDSTY